MNHFMLETRSLEDVGRAYDIVAAENVFMEYGWGGLLVDDGVWRVKHHTTTRLWGHESMLRGRSLNVRVQLLAPGAKRRPPGDLVQ